MPGYERYREMRPKIQSSVVRGSLRVEWIEGGGAFTYDKGGQTLRYDIGTRKAGPYAPPKAESGAARDPNFNRPRPARGRQYAVAYSPDGKMRAYYKDRNLWLSDPDGENPVAITTDGSAEKRTKYGNGSWVYGEELDQNEAMGFSGDGKRLWYYFFDESKVPDYYLTTNVATIQNSLYTEAYPKAGAPNPEVDLYVYDVAAKKSTKIAVRPGAFDEGIGHYVYGIRWSPDNRELWFHRTNRKQDVMEWCGADPETGKVRVIVREEWPKSWTENQPRRVFLDTDPNIEKAPAYRGKAIWFSERNGFKNLYLLDLATGALRPITQNDFEVASIVRVDLPGGRLWYMGRDGENPYKLQLHRVGLDGKGDIRLTDPRFNHTVSLAPDGRHFVDIAEAIDSPPVTRLLDGSGKVVDTLAESDLTKFKELGLRPVERIVFTAADGKTTCYGTLHVPSRLKDGEKIPLIVQVYAGPESGSDQERFQTPNPLTEMGYCVASFDGRGTSGRGKAFKDELYGKLGIVEIDDQAAGVRHLVRTKPFIDGKRVGIEGTSYGGYASIMALLRYPDVFAAACASSSVTDWRNYDTIYTERYMNTPQANPEGYDAGSATKIAASLKGRLMLYYGTADDNVHPSNTYQFVRALQSARKGYDLQVGPDAGHSGIGQERMLEFFNDWLKR
jgi:dipeptidyl-peptidase-4